MTCGTADFTETTARTARRNQLRFPDFTLEVQTILEETP
jgi:hypothetical protein